MGCIDETAVLSSLRSVRRGVTGLSLAEGSGPRTSDDQVRDPCSVADSDSAVFDRGSKDGYEAKTGLKQEKVRVIYRFTEYNMPNMPNFVEYSNAGLQPMSRRTSLSPAEPTAFRLPTPSAVRSQRWGRTASHNPFFTNTRPMKGAGIACTY